MINKLNVKTSANKHLQVLTDEQEHIMQAFNCAIGGRTATYVSGPITTGHKFIDWYISTGHELESKNGTYQEIKKEFVLSKNESDILEVANTLRKSSLTPVIEPASLHIATWDQMDYHRFWTELLRRFISRVVILDGWQYSIGCALEFHYAVQYGIEVYNQNGQPLKIRDGRKLVLDAADDIERRGGSLDALQHIAQALRAQAIKMEKLSG